MMESTEKCPVCYKEKIEKYINGKYHEYLCLSCLSQWIIKKDGILMVL